MLDKSKLPPNTWPRMLWHPGEFADATERPIVLVGDRRRFRVGGIPMILLFVVAIVLFLLRAPAMVVLALVVVVLALGIYARGGRNGYYEVASDGSLGDFLGRRPPFGLRSMRASRP